MSMGTQPRKTFSRDGFTPLPNDHPYAMNNDATIDIPLDQVPTHGSGLRTKQSMTGLKSTPSMPTSEKQRRSGRRHKIQPGAGATVGYDGEQDTITTMGKIYRKILNFSVVTRYFVYVAPLALIIAVPIIVGATAAKDATIAGVRLVYFFGWIEIVWLSLWVSKIVAHYLPYLFQVLVGVVNSGIRKYALIIKALEIPLSLVGWALCSLATFVPVMNRSERGTYPWQNTVQNILAATLVCSLIFLIEKFFIQLISINYHRKQFNARIKDSKQHLYLLSLLHEASLRLFPAYCNDFAEQDYAIADQLNLSRGLGGDGKKRKSRSGVRTPLRLIQDVGRYGDKLTSAFGNIAQEVTGREVFNPNSSHSIVSEALERKRTAEALARRIWMSFVLEGHESLTQEDLSDCLGPGREHEAEETFAALDKDGNGDISLDEMIMTVVEFSRERKSIANSMHDVDQAINVLDRLLMVAVLVAVILVFVGFLNTAAITTFATTGTALLSLSFVFATSCQEVLGSCIFLFVKHPYDIGDRVDIASEQYIVEHISLLFTVFRRVSGTGVGRTVQTPNIVLNNLWIENVTRSKAMTEQINLNVHIDTTFEDIQILKSEMTKFVTDKENNRDFFPDFDILVMGVNDLGKLELQVEIKHKSNWSNETLRAARRTKFMCALLSALRAVPIYAPGGGGEALGSSGNPSYSVAISDSDAKHNVESAAEAKEGKRLVPHKKQNDASAGVGAGLTVSENKVVDSLTARAPGADPLRDEAWASGREDSSTLGRDSGDHGDIEDVRGLLRRQSTRGKRKAGTVPYSPSIPRISEPSSTLDPSTTYLPRPYGGNTMYNTPTYQAGPTSYAPSPYQTTSNVEMSQVGRTTTTESTRNRSESLQRKPLQPLPVPDEEDDGFGNMRPYSGV